MDHKITIESPYSHAINAEKHGADPFWQRQLIEKVVCKLLADPFEQGIDLRGAEVRATLHPDGLFVTAELIMPGEKPDAVQELPIIAAEIPKRDRRWRRINVVKTKGDVL